LAPFLLWPKYQSRLDQILFRYNCIVTSVLQSVAGLHPDKNIQREKRQNRQNNSDPPPAFIAIALRRPISATGPRFRHRIIE
jgi:hypothetical protein